MQTNVKLCQINGSTPLGYYTAAAQHPPKQIKLDFYYLHCFNSSIFFPLFLSLPFLSTRAKARLLTWKARLDLAMYASRRSPELLWGEVEGYVVPSGGWEGLFKRAVECKDDGHVVKAVRAARAAEEFCKGRGGSVEWDRVGWAKVGAMGEFALYICRFLGLGLTRCYMQRSILHSRLGRRGLGLQGLRRRGRR